MRTAPLFGMPKEFGSPTAHTSRVLSWALMCWQKSHISSVLVFIWVFSDNETEVTFS